MDCIKCVLIYNINIRRIISSSVACLLLAFETFRQRNTIRKGQAINLHDNILAIVDLFPEIEVLCDNASLDLIFIADILSVHNELASFKPYSSILQPAIILQRAFVLTCSSQPQLSYY